jgi:RNA polymerase sigma factor (sigma-70 family)
MRRSRQDILVDCHAPGGSFSPKEKSAHPRLERELTLVPAEIGLVSSPLKEAARHRPSAEVRPAAEANALFPLVYRHMRSLCGGRAQDLDDLAQTAMENALGALPTFEGRSALSTWVYRICYLTLLKHRRWYFRWLRRFALTAEGDVPDAAAETPAPGEAMEVAERAARLRAALERLSPKRGAVVVLHDMEGLGVEEIAEIVGAGVLTVRSRLRDGRRDLAKLLEADPYFGFDACAEAPIAKEDP